MREDNVTIKGLWIGSKLSPNELLCIKSYLYHGHQFELYVYDSVRNVPENVIIKDAAQIIPKSDIFTYTSVHHNRSLAMFSDLFRYKLLYKLGGWWSDLDAVCVKPFDIDQPYVFMQEKLKDNKGTICGGVIKCPKNAQIIDYCFEKSKEMSMNIQNYSWAATGPSLLAQAVEEFNLNHFVTPPSYFSPISFREITRLFTQFDLSPATFSIHLFNEGWRMRNISKYGIYPKKSLIESLKKQYEVKNNHIKLLSEFIKDIKENGYNQGIKIIKTKLWHMYNAFRNYPIDSE